MLDDGERKVHVEAWPVEMAGVQQPDIAYLLDGCIPEPRELLKRQKVLLVLEEQPEAMLGNVRDLRLQNASATL